MGQRQGVSISRWFRRLHTLALIGVAGSVHVTSMAGQHQFSELFSQRLFRRVMLREPAGNASS